MMKLFVVDLETVIEFRTSIRICESAGAGVVTCYLNLELEVSLKVKGRAKVEKVKKNSGRRIRIIY